MRQILTGFIFPIYVTLSCYGLYLMKAAYSWTAISFLTGVILYVSGAIIWLAILRVYPISVAFPVASGALMIGTTLIGVFILKEHVSTMHIFGIVLIMIGITLLAYKAGIS